MLRSIEWIKKLTQKIESLPPAHDSMFLRNRVKALAEHEAAPGSQAGLERIRELLHGDWPGILSIHNTAEMAEFLEKNPNALKQLKDEIRD